MANAVLNVGASNAAFNKAITEMSSKLKTLKSDFTVASTQAKLFGNAEDQLKAKQSNLNNVIKIQKDMLETNKNKYETLQQTLQENKVKQEELNIKIKETSKALRDSVKATGEDSEATNELREKLQELNVEYSKNENAIKTNKSSLNSTYNTLNRTKASLMNNENALKNVNKELAGVKADMAAQGFKKVSEASQNVYDKTKGVSLAILGLGAGATKVAADFESGMSQVAATMGYTVDQLHNSNSQQAQDFERLKDAAKEMGAITQFSATEASEALNYLALAGYDVDKSISALPDVLNLAAAGGMDLGTACDMVTDASSALGLSTKETTELVDQMAKTSQKSNTSVSQLGEAILTVGGTANTLRGGMNEMNTALGVLANVGYKGAEGGTHLRNVILSLSAPTDTAADALQQLGVECMDADGNMRALPDILKDINNGLSEAGSAEKAQVISKIFNKTDIAAVQGLLGSVTGQTMELEEALASVNYNVEEHGRTWNDVKNAYNENLSLEENISAMMNMFQMDADQAAVACTNLASSVNDGSESWSKLSGEISNSTGSAGEQAKVMLDNLKGGITLLKSALEGLGIQIGDILLPYIKSLTQHINNFVTWLSNTDEKTKKIIVTVGLVIAAIAPIAKIISVVTGAISGILGIVSKVQGFLAMFGGLSGIFTSLGTVVTTVGSAIAGVFTTIVSIVGWPVTIVVGLIAILGTLYATCQPFREFVNNLWMKIKEFFTGLWTWITQLPQKIQTLWTTITTAVSTGWQNIVNFFTQGIPNLITSIGQLLAELPNKFAFFLGEVIGTLIQWNLNVINFLATNIPIWINNIGTWFSQLPGVIWNWLVQTITNLATWGSNMLTTATTWVSNTITTIGQWFAQLPGNIWNWLIQTVNSVISWGSSMLSAATTACTTVVNGIINTFKNLPSKMLEIGKNIVNGIKNGIKNAWNGMTGWMGGLCDSFIKGVKSKFDIHSPSRVMRDLIGKNIILGWMNGMQQNSSKLTGVGADISESLKESIKNDSDSYEDIGKAYIDSFKSGIEKQRDSAIKSATDVINKSVDEMKAQTKDKNKISELEKNGKDLISYYTKAIKEGAEDATKQIDKSISKITKEAQSKYQDILKMQDSMRSKISSYGSLYDEGKGKHEAFTLHDINQDIEDLKEYSDLLNTIRSKNIGEGLMKEITNMNIDDAKEYVYTLLELDQSDLTAYVNSYEEKQKLAEQISQEFYSKQLQDLDASFTSQIGTALNDIPTQMQTVGQQAMAGFKTGLTSQMQDLMQSCKYVGNNVLNSFKDVFDIHSPSRVMRDQVGVMLAKGLDIGFTGEMPNVNADIERTLNNTVQVSQAASKTKNQYENNNSNSIQSIIDELRKLKEAFNVVINMDSEKVGELISPKVQRDLIGLARG